MKKVTVLILLIIYLGSILIVGVFGMRAVPFEEIVYIQKIVPTSVTSSTGENLKLMPDTEKGENSYYVVVREYAEGLTLIINYNLTPADCTNKNVKISIVEPENPSATITDRGEIVFSSKGSVHVIYKPQDSATAPQMDIWIYMLAK